MFVGYSVKEFNGKMCDKNSSAYARLRFCFAFKEKDVLNYLLLKTKEPVKDYLKI